jgi:hypothetical protein
MMMHYTQQQIEQHLVSTSVAFAYNTMGKTQCWNVSDGGDCTRIAIKPQHFTYFKYRLACCSTTMNLNQVQMS